MPSQKEIDEGWRKVKKDIGSMNWKIFKELKDKDGTFLGYILDIVNFKIVVAHRQDLHYMEVTFRMDFQDPKLFEEITKLKESPQKWATFNFSLDSVLSSSDTGFVIPRNENGVPTGYFINVRIFPFHEGYNIRELNSAVRAVISVGYKGISFLKASFGGIGGPVEFDADGSEPPEGMYA